MTNIIVQPVRPQGTVLEHLNSTIYRYRDANEVLNFLPDAERAELRSLCRQRNITKLAAWGVTPKKAGQWAKIEPGDVAVFGENNKLYLRGIVLKKFHSPELAEHFWGTDDERQKWEQMYLLDDIQRCDTKKERADTLKERVDENHTGLPWLGMSRLSHRLMS